MYQDICFSAHYTNVLEAGCSYVVTTKQTTYNDYSNKTKITFQEDFTSMGGPALIIVDNQGVFWADLFGLILALPIAMFLAFWMSAVKRRAVVVLGAFIGGFIGFLIILGWVGELIFDSVLPGANPGAAFFGALFANSILALVGGILADLIVARLTRRDYRRPAPAAE